MPPPPAIVAVPSGAPHDAPVLAITLPLTIAGWVMVAIAADEVQPLLSFTVIAYEAAVRLRKALLGW